MDPAGYSIVETLHRDGRSHLVRAIRRSDRRYLILESPKTPRARQRLKTELQIGREIGGRHLARPIGWESEGEQDFLIREDVGGVPLTRLLHGPMQLGTFLDIACSLVRDVKELHREGLIHRDLRPSNILIDPDTSETWLLGLGMASRIPREQIPLVPPPLIEGSLAYMAPEQTGRTNRAIDSRSDLYSLGVIFFQMLTGRLPFEARDPIKWIHQHVAREPPSPLRLNPSIPPPLSSLVLRLLAKLPEDRYQSARGLHHDLDLCRVAFRAGDEALEGISLAEQDVSDELHLPQRLLGRSEERAELNASMEEMLTDGLPTFDVISGEAGVGKSSLARDLLRSRSADPGFFIEGDFDRYARNAPYSGIIRAFRQALQQILNEAPERRAEWKRRLQAGLAPNAQLLVEILPELELLIGPQPTLLPLPPLESMRRFHDVFLRFVQVLAQRDHPLVLFLDNLHWCDPASVAVLEYVLTDPETRFIQVIAALQEDKLDNGHPLLATLERLRRSEVRLHERVLGPLPIEAVAELLSETLRRPRSDVMPLAGFIHAKTGGNPLFSIQLLTTLSTENLIRFDAARGRWRWDLRAIDHKGYDDDVLSLLMGRLVRLPPSTRAILPLAACLGNNTELGTLSRILELPEDSLRRVLLPALQAGILSKSGETYSFVHDRLQQAAHRLIEKEELAGLHVRIGRLLRTGTGTSDRDRHLFQIADHLNQGRDLLDRAERLRLVDLNLAAGRRAIGAAGYCLASRYFSIGIELLGEKAWEDHHALSFALHLDWAKASFLLGRHDEARGILATSEAHTEDPLELAAIAVLRINFHTIRQERAEAIDGALRALLRLGVDLRDAATAEATEREARAFREALGETPIGALVDLPWMEDDRAKAIVDLVGAAALSAAVFDLPTLGSLCYRAGRIVLEKGLCDSAPVIFGFLGLVMAQLQHRYGDAYDLGRLGRELVERHDLTPHRAKVYTLSAWTSQWREPLDESAELLRRARAAAAEAGDLTFASFARYDLISVLVAMGTPLSKVQSACEDALAVVKRRGDPLIAEMIADELRLVLALRGSIGRLASLRERWSSEEPVDASRSPMPIERFSHELRKLKAHFLLGSHEEALEAADAARALLWTAPSSTEGPEFHFYQALASSSPVRDPADPKAPPVLEALEAARARFDGWAEGCEHNFVHQAALIRAEIARLRGEDAAAMKEFQRAASTARTHGFVQIEAIAYEQAASFYEERGAEEVAIHCLHSARACYLAWGAEAKVRDLDRRFPDLAQPDEPAAPAEVALPPAQLDWMAVMKAVQAISKEIGRSELVECLVHTLMEQGAAQRASFVFRRDGDLCVEAEARLRDGAIETRTTRRPLSPDRDPVSVIQYVLRTADRVIEDDASSHTRLLDDAYIAAQRVRSLLCFPVMERSGVVGIVVMENDLVSGVFSSDRLAAVELIAAQATISLEIALLVEGERGRRQKAEEEQRRSDWLARITTSMAASNGPEEQIELLADAFVPFLADIARIDLVDPGGVVRHFKVAAAPGFDPQLLEAAIQHTSSISIPDLPPDRIANLEPVLIPDMDDVDLRKISLDEEQFRYRRKLGLTSALAIPLLGRRGLIGVINLARRRDHPRYDEEDLAFLESITPRFAIAFENAELFRAAQEAIEVRDEFLSIASHELRTPTTSLLLTLQRLRRLRRRGQDGGRIDEGLALAERQTKRIAVLTETLLDVARIQGGQLDLNLETFDLRELIQDVAQPLAQSFQGKAHPLVLRLPDAPLRVEWDRLRIEQVITNLLTNALKFGDGRLVEILASQDERWVRIDVRDHGVGVSEEAQERLFEKFERGATSGQGSGLGLGLYISRKIVEAHGGKISARSELGAGSTFTVRLPPQVPGAGQED